MRNRCRTLALAVPVILCSLPTAAAQFNDQLGQTLGSQSLAGQQLGGQSLAGQSLDGQSLGNSSGSGRGTGSGLGMPSGLDSSTAFSNVQRGTDVGATGQTGRGFSDASVAPPQAGLIGGTTPGGIGGGRGGLGGIGGFGGFGPMADRLGGPQSEAPAPAIRTRLQSAIQIQAPSPEAVGRRAMRRLRSLPSQRRLGGVNVSMRGPTAVLQGTVDEPSSRRMSELLLRLEPGVREVDNRLTVGR